MLVTKDSLRENIDYRHRACRTIAILIICQNFLHIYIIFSPQAGLFRSIAVRASQSSTPECRFPLVNGPNRTNCVANNPPAWRWRLWGSGTLTNAAQT
ncbi:hypothetical protein IG631_12008 [Alternaria alternata]|nr:hypothetical protein IG631_12008 [Alternaria alternata]